MKLMHILVVIFYAYRNFMIEGRCTNGEVSPDLSDKTCRRYFVCTYGRLIEHHCLHDFVFSKTRRTCVPTSSSYNDCYTYTTYRPKYTTYKYIACKEGETRPHPKDCYSYYICSYNAWKPKVCPKNNVYSKTVGKCVLAYSPYDYCSKTTYKMTTTTPGIYTTRTTKKPYVKDVYTTRTTKRPYYVNAVKYTTMTTERPYYIKGVYTTKRPYVKGEYTTRTTKKPYYGKGEYTTRTTEKPYYGNGEYTTRIEKPYYGKGKYSTRMEKPYYGKDEYTTKTTKKPYYENGEYTTSTTRKPYGKGEYTTRTTKKTYYGKGQRTTSYPTTETNVCVSGETFAVWNDCYKYYHCVNGKLEMKTCVLDFVYSKTLKRCVPKYSKYADCNAHRSRHI